MYDTAQLEEKQFNKPHATKLYRQIVEEYPSSPYANQAKTRLAELEKRVRYSSRKPRLKRALYATARQCHKWT